MSERRVTARVVRTPDGRCLTEYQVGDVTYSSLAALQAAVEAA